MSAPIGHNSAAFGEELREDLEALLTEDSDKLFIYAQWHIGDYIIGTQGMTLEHEGAYQRFLMRLYARGKPLPDDDGIMASIMSLSTRVWRRIKLTLIDLGKIIVRAGCLTNARFEKERQRRAEQLRKRSQAAHQRWSYERENNAEKEREAERVSPKFATSLPETSGKLSENIREKLNENNDDDGKSAYANQEPITNIRASFKREHTREDIDAIQDKLFHAGGDALSCASPSLLSIAEPLRWLDNGCDLEADVLPTIRRCVAGKPKNHVQGWLFFTKAVQEARDRRLLPMEAPTQRAPQQRSNSQHADFYEQRAQETKEAWSKINAR